MRVKYIAFDGNTDEYNVHGFCGHCVTIPISKWICSPAVPEWIHCDKCEAEYKLVERMLHLMYEKKVRFMRENEDDR